MGAQTELTEAGKKRLHAAEARVERARVAFFNAQMEWARVVRDLGQAAVSREMMITPQAVADRLCRIEPDPTGVGDAYQPYPPVRRAPMPSRSGPPREG